MVVVADDRPGRAEDVVVATCEDELCAFRRAMVAHAQSESEQQAVNAQTCRGKGADHRRKDNDLDQLGYFLDA